MHLGFEWNVCRKKIPLRISSHRIEGNIKIVPKKQDWRLWSGFVSVEGPAVGCCEHRSETSGYMCRISGLAGQLRVFQASAAV